MAALRVGLTGFLRTPRSSLTHTPDDAGMRIEIPEPPSRRQILTLLGGAGGIGLLTLAGCASGSDSASTGGGAASSATSATTAGTTSTTAAAASTATVASAVPEETGGPFPGDGSNGPDYLGMNGAVRSDIRTSLGSSAAAAGVPMTVKLTVLDLKNSAKPLSNAGIYLWHCDQAGRYSMYTQGATNETFCRGIQATDSNGTATFTSVWPGAYSGRWPHIHFQVYPSVSSATSATGKLKTSQIALPEAACDVVYETDGYSASIRNMTQTSLSTDNVFRDGWSQELATANGSTSSGYTATLVIGV
jgi:protocatechuate 3,4-dioxygenase beta subunit